MTDLICRETMQRCQHPGMCSPHGGCRPVKEFDAGQLDLGRFVDWVWSLKAERDQLKAENAGLRTGYQAYEDVNAGLKAEIEALHASMKEMCAMYTHVWDREDGALVCFSSNVERFDKAHEAAWALINPAKEAAHD